jgi:ATP-dependent 26S proteasome regulatory subunit
LSLVPSFQRKGEMQGDQSVVSGISYPTFGLALEVFPHAHWDALTPLAPLRYWRLLNMGHNSTLIYNPLSIDEYILHYLTGISCPDAHLAHMVTSLPPSTMDDLVPSQRTQARRLVSAWSHYVNSQSLANSVNGHHKSDPTRWWSAQRINGYAMPVSTARPIIQLCGEDNTGKQSIAAAACNALGLSLKRLHVDMLPQQPDELMLMSRLWERSAALNSDVLFLECGDTISNASTQSDAPQALAVGRLSQQLNSPLIVASRERISWPDIARPLLTIDVARPGPDEQRTIWHSALATCNQDANSYIEQIVSQFSFSSSAIHATAAEALAVMQNQTDLATLLWDSCRMRTRPGLDELSQRIEAQADWHDLVLPEAQQQILREIVIQVQQRTTVYETWNFKPAGGKRGLGISALFAGASGTGKTLASEVLAHALRLDLYRIDLSSVVSKYIGETEKNLRRIFDAAEEGGVVLLFDEADALFGKRSEVKDSHDRYANIEVSYLLQRIESYSGLAILTTNLKQALDSAFLRRIRFVVQFPFPDVAQRTEIWQRIFPPSLPTSGVNIAKLARLNIAGGNIRNIALNAAFLAAGDGGPLQMQHLLRATISEYGKLEKPLTEAEIRGWL